MANITHEDVMAIIKVTGVKLDGEKIDPKESFSEQGADSLDMINIIFAIQEKYGIEITDEAIADGEWLTLDKMVINLNKPLEQK